MQKNPYFWTNNKPVHFLGFLPPGSGSGSASLHADPDLGRLFKCRSMRIRITTLILTHWPVAQAGSNDWLDDPFKILINFFRSHTLPTSKWCRNWFPFYEITFLPINIKTRCKPLHCNAIFKNSVTLNILKVQNTLFLML